jgi:hypothetical protein
VDGAAGVMAETEEEAEEFQRVFDGGRALTLVAIAAGMRHDGWDDEAIARSALLPSSTLYQICSLRCVRWFF